MYNIIQLNDKNLSELQVIAKELGIKKADSYKKEDLVYNRQDFWTTSSNKQLNFIPHINTRLTGYCRSY